MPRSLSLDVRLALDLGIDRMHDYLAMFGFGARTGIDLLGENAGVLPSRAWKRGQFGQPWYPLWRSGPRLCQ